MLEKRILPETFDFGVPSVDIIETGSKGLDKQAMEKRASAFGDVIDKLETKPNRTYLHVITTGAMEKYAENRNGDAFNESAHEHTCPFPEDGAPKTVMMLGGLKQFHDSSYMSKEAGVYQEHKTKDTDPSGEIIAAHYNDDMHRGEPRIADFDTYLAHYDSLDVDSAFERFAANKEVQWDTVADSSALAAGQCLSQRDPFLHLQIKALLADCLFGRGHYYRIMKVRDPVYNAALVQLRQRKSVK